ncbi:unnamed protein product [Ilex paraguariensis]|uniref:Uncharacterized protein n=1 Tax=Ilex paraguariensis TaxID=185542 RepID=A0ABC8TXL9_9AQUA
MATEARLLNLKQQIVDEVPLVQFVDRLAIPRRSLLRHTHPPPSGPLLTPLPRGEQAEAFFEILELLDSNGSKIGAMAEKINDMQNIVLSSIQQTLDEVYDSLTNKVSRLMRLLSIHCDVKMIKAVGFKSQLFGYIVPITILDFPENQQAIMVAEARRLNLKKSKLLMKFLRFNL